MSSSSARRTIRRSTSATNCSRSRARSTERAKPRGLAALEVRGRRRVARRRRAVHGRPGRRAKAVRLGLLARLADLLDLLAELVAGLLAGERRHEERDGHAGERAEEQTDREVEKSRRRVAADAHAGDLRVTESVARLLRRLVEHVAQILRPDHLQPPALVLRALRRADAACAAEAVPAVAGQSASSDFRWERAASMKTSMSPSSTRVGSPTSTPVRWSFTTVYGCST